MPGRGLAEVLEALPGTGGYVKPLEQLRTRPDAGGWLAEALPGTGRRAEACEALEQPQTVPGSGGGRAQTRADLTCMRRAGNFKLRERAAWIGPGKDIGEGAHTGGGNSWGSVSSGCPYPISSRALW